MIVPDSVQERHPREQGLKLLKWREHIDTKTVQERHPREQGLKLAIHHHF